MMNDLKKAFSKLDKEKMPEDRKQEIFDCLTKEYSRVKKQKKIFAAAVPVFAALVIAAAAFFIPGILSPKQSPSDMVLIPRPDDNMMADTVLSIDEPQVVSTVVLSLNPIVELGLGADGSVLEAKGLDEDGERLLAGIECEGLSLENAAIVVVNQLLLNDYITSDVDTEEIKISIESEQMGIDTLDVVTQTIQTAAKKHDIEVSVTPSEQTKELSIVLTGDEKTSDQPSSENNLVTVEFLINAEDPSVVDDVSAHTEENERLITSIEFDGMPFKAAVLYGINDLIKQGYINDKGTGRILLKLNVQDETKAATLKYLTDLLLLQAGIDLEAAGTGEPGVFELSAVDAQKHEDAKFTMSKILDPTVHKAKEDLTKTQAEILELVYTQEQIEELLAIRYWIVVPNLVGLSEEKAVQILTQMGLVPVVTNEYAEQYSDLEEGTVFYQDFSAGAMLEKGDRFGLHVLSDKFGPLGEGWTQSLFPYSEIGGDAGAKTEYEVYNSGAKEIYLEIANNSEDNVLEYDTDFTLERYYDGEWYSFVCTKCYEPSTKTLMPLDVTSEKIDMSFAGDLEDGRYRIIKQLGQFKYTAEFEIENGGYDANMLSGYAPLSDLPKDYTPETAAANGDFTIDAVGNVYNEGSMSKFLQKVKKNLPCKVRRTMFTIEGDAIIDDFEFNGKYFSVVNDTTRDEFGVQGIEKHIYSYLTLGYFEDRMQLLLANTYDRIPMYSEYNNADSYVLLHDADWITGEDITAIAQQIMDEDAPLKVYSPDGMKYVSYTDGKKAVNFEVNTEEKQYAGGIILPEDKGEAAEMISLEWRDDEVVLITYRTFDDQYIQLAHNVLSDERVQLSEEEAAGNVEQDYFTDEDRKTLMQQFFNEANEFVFTITQNGKTTVYSADRLGAKIENTQDSADTQEETVDWNEQKMAGFLSTVMGCNVYEWNILYEKEFVLSADENTQEENNQNSEDDTYEWSLVIKGNDPAVVSSGKENEPDEFGKLLSVIEEYFNTVSQDSI